MSIPIVKRLNYDVLDVIITSIGVHLLERMVPGHSKLPIIVVAIRRMLIDGV